jgi:hypothetical protein
VKSSALFTRKCPRNGEKGEMKYIEKKNEMKCNVMKSQKNEGLIKLNKMSLE